MTRVALFGCGWIQDFHARGVLAHGDELVAVANHREESARAFAERYDDPSRDDRLGGAGRRPRGRCGGRRHAERAARPAGDRLAANGKHVMVEKPMAISVAECDAMIAASRDGGASLMVAHCWRFRDEVRAMRDRIVSGELGDVVETHGYGVHAGWGPSGWFTDPALAGGGALVDMGVHAIDTARFLLGDPVPGDVCARRSARRYARGALHGRRRRRPVDHVERRRDQRGGVGLVAAAPGRARGGHGGLRHEGVRADLAARASVPPTTSTAAQPMYTRAGRGVPGRDRRGTRTPADRARTAASSCRWSSRPMSLRRIERGQPPASALIVARATISWRIRRSP